MDNPVVGAIVALLASAGLAWLLQRWKPGLHPAATAGITLGALVLLTVLVAGVVIVRTLIVVGAAGGDQTGIVDGPGLIVATAFISGVLEILLLAVIGFPAAWLVASRVRRRTGA
jgi:hypothetical protein